MCIIVAKPSGVEMPTIDILQQCWKRNPDGAGFMWAQNNCVYIQKGLMKWENFEYALKRLQETVNLKDTSIIFHFRISTQAGVNPQNTHPFPITKDVVQLTSTKAKSHIGGLVHNGIISKYTVKNATAYSDTLLFVKYYVADMIKRPYKWNTPENLKKLEEVSKSKLAILSPDGTIAFVGLFNESKGVKYSNYTWGSYTTYYSGGTPSYGNHFYDEEWGEYGDYGGYGGNYHTTYYGGRSNKSNATPSTSKTNKTDSKKNTNKATASPTSITPSDVRTVPFHGVSDDVVTLYPTDAKKHCYYDSRAMDYVAVREDVMFYDLYAFLWLLDDNTGTVIPYDLTIYDDSTGTLSPAIPKAGKGEQFYLHNAYLRERG